MKKSFFVFIVLLVFSGIIFYFGWIQLRIPAGQYGVLVSKTGGVNDQTIVPGSFRWQWELLLPTNAEVIIFDLIPISHTEKVSGILPSASVYSHMIEGTPDFSWQFTCDTKARVTPDFLPNLVESHSIRNQQALDLWTQKVLSDRSKSQIEAVVQKSIESLASKEGSQLQVELITQNIVHELQIAGEGIEITSVFVTPNRFPDLELYRSAAATYETYQHERRISWTKTATESSSDSVSDYLSFERYSRWGELLTRYPILIDFFTSAGAENHPLKNMQGR
ncbi:MAG TPA: hypothetical protein GXZ47_05390 [Treponema sp.]|nr:hypothetical protein [Treponema sp.]